jgi:CdiI immunity protein
MRESGRPRNTVPPSPPQIDPRDFAALRELFRGYFHQDWKQEYGTIEQAVQQFARDTDPEQRAEVARQWTRFVELTRPQPLPIIVRLLTSALGSSWIPTDVCQLEALTHALQQSSE